MINDLKLAKKQAIEAARDLGYSPKVRDRIKEANSIRQITNILAEARRAA